MAFVATAVGVVACGGKSIRHDDGAAGDGGEEPNSEPTCRSMCAKAARCDGFNDDCVTACENGERFAQQAGCTAQLRTLLRCLEAAPDICSAEVACSSPSNTFSVCLLDGCTGNRCL